MSGLVRHSSLEHWCRAFFRTNSKFDIHLNNMCESINSIILQARSKHILGMLESIRMYLTTRHELKREWIRNKRVWYVQR